ncbi:hypothetical protein SDC9_71395 [bioreactor metagenome]|uniref:Uncharacterized protein n=1 Tax=bioreactor metagenome TaxID=1076179 RepID=A0A644Y9Q2_9ZZZZ
MFKKLPPIFTVPSGDMVAEGELSNPVTPSVDWEFTGFMKKNKQKTTGNNFADSLLIL